MSIQKRLPYSPETITIVILTILACINAPLAVITGYFGHFIAFGFYTYVIFLCRRNNHYQAGIIAGIFGFGIHLFELIFQGVNILTGIQVIVFFINLILPVFLVYFSYRTVQQIKHKSRIDE